MKWRADPVRMNNLRVKFVEQCKQYFGVPYAKKYQQPGSKISTCIYSNDVHSILISKTKEFSDHISKHGEAYLKRAENMMRSGVFLMIFDVFGLNMIHHCFECLIYLVN